MDEERQSQKEGRKSTTEKWEVGQIKDPRWPMGSIQPHEVPHFRGNIAALLEPHGSTNTPSHYCFICL